MWGDYDENLQENPFFVEILTSHSDILKKASDESWIVCIPQIANFQTNENCQCEITIENILDHILVPNKNNCCTLSKKQVTIESRRISTGNRKVAILFEETFYISETSLKYSVWCVEKPLFVIDNLIESSNKCKSSLENFHDCLDFLWERENVLSAIKNVCGVFCKSNQLRNIENVQNLREIIGEVYSKCLQVALNTCNYSSNLKNFKIAVEAFMQYSLKNKIIKALGGLMNDQDTHLNKIIKNSNHLQLKDLNITSKFSDVIIGAKFEFSQLNNHVSTLDKLRCLKLTFNRLFDSRTSNGVVDYVTSDDILQIFVFLIIKSNINNLITNLIYLTKFSFNNNSNCNQSNFLLTTLEATLEYIKSNEFLSLSQNKFWRENQSSQLNSIVFESVKNGNLIEFQKLLDNLKNKQKMEKLCHPLCTCRNCLEILNTKTEDDLESLQNCLIYAISLNKRDFIEFLLTKLDNVNFSDDSGKTPLHHSCLKGYQDILLILINAKCDVNLKDNEGNTCLHSATINGHDNCIKALLYTSNKKIDINCRNEMGETPLHLAVRWGYVDIIRILLENGASSHVLNNRNQTPEDLISNYLIENVLKEYKKWRYVIIHKTDLEEFDMDAKLNKSKKIVHFDVADKYKKIDLLLKAIENNDLPLTKFYLGLNVDNNQKSNGESPTNKCHPLCNCEKCYIDENFDNELSYEPIVNINSHNVNGWTPLHQAVKYGRTEIVNLLLNSQAKSNLKTFRSLQTPLHLACIYQKMQIVRNLVKCDDCQIDEVDVKGNTPLFYACINNNKRTVQVLLSHGADCCIRNHEGKTILRQAQENMLYGVFKLLKHNLRMNSEGCNTDSDEFTLF